MTMVMTMVMRLVIPMGRNMVMTTVLTKRTDEYYELLNEDDN